MKNDMLGINLLNNTKQANKVKEKAAIENGLTDPSRSIGSALRGINFLNTGLDTAFNTDVQGITLFTRPYLNFKDKNLVTERKLTTLLTEKPHSIYYAIRRLLDTKMSLGVQREENCLIDTRQAFITIFTNLLTGISGWPDESIDMFVSQPGLRNQVYMLVDHPTNEYGAFDLTATFKNIAGDPISNILLAWQTYAKGVALGSLMPYPEMIANRIIDYETRIYRLVLDVSKRWVQKIACCGAAFPTANPIGSSFNFSSDTPLVSDTNEISVPFKAIGYCYNDPIIVRDFNTTVYRFNKKMKDDLREKLMILVPSDLYSFFNYLCYPRITSSMELQWWCDRDIFKDNIIKHNIPLSRGFLDKWGLVIGEENAD